MRLVSIFCVCFFLGLIARADESFFSKLSAIKETFLDENGKPHSLSEFSNKNLILTMSYTECKKTCPLVTVATLKDFQHALDENKKSAEVIVFTFDPENDTPEVLAQYRKNKKLDFQNWHFFTGDKKSIHEVAKILGLADYFKIDDHIQHSYKILVVNSKGELLRTYDWDQHEDGKDVRLFTEDIKNKTLE